MNLTRTAALTAAAAIMLGAIGCKDSPTGGNSSGCSFEGGKPVSLVSPKNGDSYKTGDTVTIVFKVDRNQMTTVHTQVSHDEGIEFSDIADSALKVPSGDQFQCMEQKWVVGKGADTLTYARADTAMLWIHKYGSYDVGVLFDNVKILIRGN